MRYETPGLCLHMLVPSIFYFRLTELSRDKAKNLFWVAGDSWWLCLGVAVGADLVWASPPVHNGSGIQTDGAQAARRSAPAMGPSPRAPVTNVHLGTRSPRSATTAATTAATKALVQTPSSTGWSIPKTGVYWNYSPDCREKIRVHNLKRDQFLALTTKSKIKNEPEPVFSNTYSFKDLKDNL